MNKTLRALQQRRAKAVQTARAMLDLAANEDRDLDETENAQYESIRSQIATLNTQIIREEDLLETERNASALIVDDGPIHVEENALQDPRRGFHSLGEFARAVQAACVQGGRIDERLAINAAAPPVYGNEGTGADGGYLVPPEYSQQIWTQTLDEDNLLQFTDGYTVTGNSMVFPKDETVPWGTDGVDAYWLGEAAVKPPTKPKFGTTTLRLKKLAALVPLTDELIADASALSQYLSRKIADKIRWKTNEAIVFGPGGAQPLGALVSAAAIVVPKEGSQTTGTLDTKNLVKMVSRLPSQGSFGRAVWLINNEVLPALLTLTLGNYPIFIPPGGGRESPFGSILGRPAIISQHANAFSSQGDVILLDLSYYRVITKASGIETATSIHLYFDADVTAFRAVFRIDGEPIIAAPIPPAKGTTTLSPFIQLGAR